jgi:putative ABC transport system substrate-binding protein
MQPLSAQAQQTKRVGMLWNGDETLPSIRENFAAVEQALAKLGWVAGRNIYFETRYNGGDAQRARAYAAELVKLSPDVVLAASTTNLTAVRLATRTIPIVFASVSDPVVQGFVPSLMRPGSNITGFAAYEFSIAGKWLDLLKQMAPTITRVALVFNPETSAQSRHFLGAIKEAAPSIGVEVSTAPVHTASEIDGAMADFARQPGGGLIFPTDSFVSVHSEQIIELAARHRLPAIFGDRLNFNKGGLMYYGQTDVTSAYRGAATYIDRILKGAQPGDLPVQLPTRYSLAINLKAAKALGLDVPISLLLIADEQIE